MDGAQCVAPALADLAPGPVSLFGVGKAACSMVLGARATLGSAVRETLVITKDGHVDPRLTGEPEVVVMESAHPVPDARSLAAGAELEQRVVTLAADRFPVFLVSGGSSSLVESLRPGVTLDELRSLNAQGLAAGWDIARLNAERATLSRLKGGGVARSLGRRPALALFLSDVPGDDPAIIGSGLLGEAAGHADSVRRLVVGNNAMAARRVVEVAAAQGLELEWRQRPFEGNAAAVGAEFLEALRLTTADGLVWGGESTVVLPAQPGRGGRNQHLALSLARMLRADESMHVLAAGTDGTDGPTDDAGAIVDAGTVQRAELGGVDVERAWRDFDSGLALEASGDLVHTGPTGTNVGDLLIGIKRFARRLHGSDGPRML